MGVLPEDMERNEGAGKIQRGAPVRKRPKTMSMATATTSIPGRCRLCIKVAAFVMSLNPKMTFLTAGKIPWSYILIGHLKHIKRYVNRLFDDVDIKFSPENRGKLPFYKTFLLNTK